MAAFIVTSCSSGGGKQEDTGKQEAFEEIADAPEDLSTGDDGGFNDIHYDEPDNDAAETEADKGAPDEYAEEIAETLEEEGDVPMEEEIEDDSGDLPPEEEFEDEFDTFEETFIPEIIPDAGYETTSNEKEMKVLKFINSIEATYAVLRYDVGLTGKAAANLIEAKDGRDGLLGTADDDPFESLDEIDLVPEIGEKSLEKIIRYAMNWQEGIMDPLLDFTSDPETTLDILDEDVGLTSTAAKNIIAVKSGKDGIYGTDDDAVFSSRGEIDAIPYVGTWSLQTLEEYIGLGKIEKLSSVTTAHLMSAAYFSDGTAFIAGIPVGGEPFAILYNPFSEEAYTTEDDPYQFIDLSANVTTPLYGAASDPFMEVALTGGEGGEIYRYDAWLGGFTVVEVPAPGIYHSFVFSPDGAYALFLEMSGEILSYDTGFNEVSYWGSAPINSLTFTGNASILAGAGEAGTVLIGNGNSWEAMETGAEEDLFKLLITPIMSEVFAVGDFGTVLKASLEEQTGGFDRLPTKAVQGLKAAAFSPAGS
ncbi:MAG: hypothetical protein FJ088_10305, partial [Deltaproteobacteria bacterium]|nr:hypothetical protein [Deltaproteobacteria bacterium]